MGLPRIFHPFPLDVGERISLTKETSSHLLRVLRLNKGEPFILFNGKGGEYRAKIDVVQKDLVGAVLESFVSVNTESPLAIYLGQGISRGEKMDLTIQKSVELGVYQIAPLFTEFCNVRLEGERIEKRRNHWQKIAISACEQSQRVCVPEVLAPQSLEAWLQNSRGFCVVCDPRSRQSFSKLKIDESKKISEITLLIGPEGGFSEGEILLAEQRGFHAVTLGPRILRTETAGLVALTLVQSLWGDL